MRLGCQNAGAVFREGQEDAVRVVAEGKGRLLVVQRTGWGKSFVYFIAAKLLREAGGGAALLVSPLLALMRNQIAAAERMGLRAITINSENTEEWESAEQKILADEADILLISPERLANERFQTRVLARAAERISLLVIDEAHCISDWGHDFRPHYRLLARMIEALPGNLRLLATTATANDRVVDDLRETLGANIKVMRGDLSRRSLILQTMDIPPPARRLAWLAERLREMRGSGIIYALTVRDAERVAAWLRRCGFAAESYTSESEKRPELEQALLENKIKALVATTALGMGFDKPDLAFVIHYQSPGSVVAYYQQVGRAGRALKNAHCVLLHGAEDGDINDHFINTAFPSREEAAAVVGELKKADGLTLPELTARLNIRKSRAEKTLQLLSLESPAPVVKEGTRWRLTAAQLSESFWRRAQRLTQLRREEQKQMRECAALSSGHMRFLVAALDGDADAVREPPGSPLSEDVNPALAREAAAFLRRSFAVIKPRKMWPSGMPDGLRGKIAENENMREGRALCVWGDGGWSDLVRAGKYESGEFGEELAAACARLIAEWNPRPRPEWITCAPSLRHPDLLSGFARRLAALLALEFRAALKIKTPRPPQKEMQNSAQQARNVFGAAEVCGGVLPGAVLLVDDIMDSGWTLTFAARLLRQNGAGEVFPFVLADAAGRMQ